MQLFIVNRVLKSNPQITSRLVSAYLNKVVPGVVKHMGTTFVEFIDLMLKETEMKGCNEFNCDVNKHWSPMNFR